MIRIAWAARSARSTLAPTAVDHSGGTAPGCLGAPAASHQPRHGEFSLSKTVLPDWARSPGDREKVRLWGVGSAPGLRGTDGGRTGVDRGACWAPWSYGLFGRLRVRASRGASPFADFVLCAVCAVQTIAIRGRLCSLTEAPIASSPRPLAARLPKRLPESSPLAPRLSPQRDSAP
jgi:hypothetical protein